MSLSVRRAWIEMTLTELWFSVALSLSVRRAWIEMKKAPCTPQKLLVALRKESVDRNVNLRVVDGSKSSVALRKESVDRNIYWPDL